MSYSFYSFDELKSEFIEKKRQRGEHVLSKDCWCDPEVIEVS